ncbi:MAG: hypothetical protein ACPGOV_09690 [Magnetovibrionaceae bacterium]
MTILSSITAQDYSTNLLLQQVRRYNEQQRELSQNRAFAEGQSRINSLNIDARRLSSLQSDLDSTVDQINGNVTRAATIRTRTEDLVSQVVTAGSYGDGSTYDLYRSTFNSLLRSINSTAESGSLRGDNLLGEQPTSGLSYTANIRGLTNTVSDTYLGSDYYLEEAGGNIWVPDRSVQILRQRSATGAETGVYASITEGLRVDSVTGTSVTFTINYNTADSQQFTATLNTSGLGIVDAWYYADLSTADGRTRALTDLNSAKATIDVQLARLRAALAEAEFYQNENSVARTAAAGLIDNATAAQLVALQDVDSDFARRNDITTNAIRASQLIRNEYRGFFNGGSNAGITGALIDVIG